MLRLQACASTPSLVLLDALLKRELWIFCMLGKHTTEPHRQPFSFSFFLPPPLPLYLIPTFPYSNAASNIAVSASIIYGSMLPTPYSL